MLTDTLTFYDLTRPLTGVGTFETEHHRQLIADIKTTIPTGRVIAISGIVGPGKTLLVRRLQEELERAGKIIVSKSLAVDKHRSTLVTLINALFCDVSGERDVQIPKQGEKREREPRLGTGSIYMVINIGLLARKHN